MKVSHKDISTTEITQFSKNERFLKLPIEKMLGLLEIEPIEPQYALINAINDPRFRFICAALSRRTGKTFISNLIANLVTLVPGSTILVMAPNYALANISWDEQLKFLNTFGVEIKKASSRDRVLELENGSTLRIGSISRADSVVGRSYDLILFDECALDENGKQVYNIQLRPTLDKPNSKAIFISTPRGMNWFYEFYMRGFSTEDKWERWASIHSTVEDNPRAIPEDVEDARRGMSKAEFEQEYYCSFTVQQGLVWNFNRNNIMPIKYDESWDVVCGLDMGFKDYTAFVVLLSDGVNFYAVDEYLDKEKTTSFHASEIKKLVDKYEADFVYIDHSAAQTRADLAYDYDISCAKANKSKLDGIGYVASIVDWDRLFVSPNCVNVIDALNNYRWDTRPGRVKEDTIHDEYSHMADALRYAMYSYAPNMESVGGIS